MAGSLRMTAEQVEAHQKRVGKLVAGPALQAQTAILKAKRTSKESPIEALFAQQVEAAGLPKPERQFKGAVPGRKYRLDFCFPEQRVVVEVQGMAHRIKERFKADTEKMSLLAVNGWIVLPVSGDDVRSGRAVQWLATVLAFNVSNQTMNARSTSNR